MNIFPVGWCETNGYQLRPPRKAIGISSVLFAVVSWVDRDGETFKSRLLQNYCWHHWIWKHSPCTENACATVPLAVRSSWNPYNSKTGSVGLRPLDAVWVPGNDALVTIKKSYLCVCTHTHAMHILLSELFLPCVWPQYWFYTCTCASEINAVTKQCWVCIRFGVEVKGTSFLNGPDGYDPLMTTCWKVNPTCSNYTSK